ncbi:MAG: type II secretion system minor pseudopilin GspI [Spongiibacteraceae bacterium]
MNCISGRNLRSDRRGFTLVEVLVAMAIVALAVTAVLVSMMRQVDGTIYLRDKMIAHWVAQNQLELALLRNAASNRVPSDTESGSVDMAGSTWYWRAEPKRTGAQGFVQLEISVAASEDKNVSPLASLTAVLDMAHKTP